MLEATERDDLERYLDVTRGELFFSKGIILVEGDSEKFLLPTLAKLYDSDLDFDALGITVCSIGGTNFTPYIRLLSHEGLDIPFCVLTDYDPKGAETSAEDADPDEPSVANSYGENRIVNQIMKYLMLPDEWEKSSFAEILGSAAEYGIFLNRFTFEVDLFQAGAENAFAEAINDLTENKKMKMRFENLSRKPEDLAPIRFLKDLDSLGKGRVAQRVASILLATESDVCPPYIKSAFEYLRAKLA